MATAAIKHFFLDDVDWGGGVFVPSLDGVVNVFPLLRGIVTAYPLLKSGVKLVSHAIGSIKLK